MFREGWNHHGIRGLHNINLDIRYLYQAFFVYFPQTLVHLICSLMLEIYNYGVDADKTLLPVTEENGVSVPESHLVIPDSDWQHLQEIITSSDNYGINLYECVVEYLESILRLLFQAIAKQY